MDKSIKFFANTILVLMFPALVSCLDGHHHEDFVYRVVIDSASISKDIVIPLKETHYQQKVIILKNTLDDTCKIGIQEIPPGKTGILYSVEIGRKIDTLKYPYVPYKAKSGTLVYDHVFTDY